jgi:plasmid stabilization system protein ParE
MASGSGNDHPQRLVLYSPEADLDLADIHTHSAKVWGREQADRYLIFLREEALSVVEGERQGKPVPRRADLRYIAATWHDARAGHRIVYEAVPNGIFVVRVLHTAMYMPRHVDPQ